MYFRALCHGYAFNCHFVYLDILGACLLIKRKHKFLFHLYAIIAKSETHICSNKHETGPVVGLDRRKNES